LDRLNEFRRIIRQTICNSPYYVHGLKGTEIETQFICDEESGRYLLLNIGWQGKTRVFSPVLYVCLKQDKIWIEEDWTENGITDDLLRAGVKNDEIVLGFQHPKMRPLTDFAIA
jgi:muramidase (phage lysozyme)